MAKKKSNKIDRASPVVCDPVTFTAEEQETIFKRDYEFNKRAPVRSPVQGWEYKYMNEGGPYSRVPQTEVNLVKGNPHKFRGVRTGNIYSGRPSIKRIPSK